MAPSLVAGFRGEGLSVGRILTLAALVAWAVAFWTTTAALAQATPPACPSAPAAYTGPDDVVGAITAQRADAAQTCAVLEDRLAQLHTDAGELATRSKQVDTITAVDAVTTRLGQPLDVNVSSQPDPGTVAAVDNVGTVLHSDVWYVAGLVAALIAAFGLYRVVMPRG